MNCFIMISGVWFYGTVVAEHGDCVTVRTATGWWLAQRSELRAENPRDAGEWPV